MVIKLTVSLTRPHPLISLWPPFYYSVKGAKGHMLDDASIILRRKGWSLAMLPSCAFLRGSTQRVPDQSWYICSAQFANLSDFEIALRKLKIAKLLTNFETRIRFRNCVALLHILKIASFLKQTPPIDTIVARSVRRRHSIVYSCCV